MLTAGKWIASKPIKNKTAGFHLSSLYSPAGWANWETIVAEKEEAEKKPSTKNNSWGILK